MSYCQTTTRSALVQRIAAALTLCAFLTGTSAARAQTFPSGSLEHDGPFDLTGRSGQIAFNPEDFMFEGHQIDADGDLVFHFTRIIIPTNVTLKMSAEWTNGPVYLLASENVTIAGTIDLSGGYGHPRTTSSALRVPPLPGSTRFPGPGGFAGALGGNVSLGLALPGSGPGGGVSINGHVNGWWVAYGATATANEWLVPLVGGSGGGSVTDHDYGVWSSGGGSGGGAILIATSKTLDLAPTGRIYADGGGGGRAGDNACDHWSGGGGGGGSIRLLATKMTGSGRLQTYGRVSNEDKCTSGTLSHAKGANGRVRLEAYEYAAGYFFDHASMTRGVPYATYVPTTKPPVLWVSEINNQQLPKEPAGGFGSANGVNEYVTLQDPIAPDEPTTIVISGENLPTPMQKSLTPTLHVLALEGKDIVKPCDQAMADPDDTGILTCTVTIPGGTQSNPSFPPGYSRAYAKVSWN